MQKRKILILIIAVLILSITALMLAGCNADGSGFLDFTDSLGGGGTVENVTEITGAEDVLEVIEAFSTDDSDLETVIDWESASYVTVTLAQNATALAGNYNAAKVYADNNIITIKEAGTYVFSGALTDGGIYVNVDDNVKLILNGVQITNSKGAAVALFGKKKKVITLEAGTTNILTDASLYTQFYDSGSSEPNGALFSKKALTINGTGSLTVNANYNNGISCKDNLKILGGSIAVTAVNNAVKGNNSVTIKGGILQITSGGDGIKSDGEGEEEGYIYISEANITIVSGDDGMQAYRSLQIVSGTLNITAGGGSAANKTSATANSRPGWESSKNASADEESRKGIKSDNYMLIEGGTLTIDAYDDTVHSNDTIIITGGAFALQSGDDAIHADERIYISGGTIAITKSYEGIEAAKVAISGGTISIVSSDDGINGADGTSNPVNVSNPNCSIIISGGHITVNAGGDGIDSNGTLLISGGTVYINGPASGADAALDTDGGILINGGTVVAVGSVGMVETPGKNSKQTVICLALSTAKAANTQISVKDASGNVLISFTSAKQFQSVILSSPDFVNGETYSIYFGTVLATSVKISGIINSVGGSGGNGPGRR